MNNSPLTVWYPASITPLANRKGHYLRKLPDGRIFKSFWDGRSFPDSDQLEWCGAESPAKRKRRSKIAMQNAISRVKQLAPLPAIEHPIQPPAIAPGVIPLKPKLKQIAADCKEAFMALDSAELQPLYAYASQAYAGRGFPGYPYLSELARISEYRAPVETIALEMTRKWIKLRSIGEGDKTEKLAILEEEFKRHKIQSIFKKAMEHDGFFGRGQIYIDIEGTTAETRQIPLVVNKATIPKGSLKGFKNIEPIWVTPYAWNAIDPTADDFFKPTSWFVLGVRTHATRLITIISREVPDILKPAFNFSGLSLSQMLETNVNAWLKTKRSVNDLIHSYSLTGIRTDLDSLLEDDGEDGDDLVQRIELFNLTRDNRNLLMLQNGVPGEGEEFFQFNTPLSGLDKLQAQAQEHMAAPAHIPLIKMFGITPAGLNASAEGELLVFEDHISAKQDADMNDALNLVLQIVQLDVFGEIDPAIGYEYVPLRQLDGKALAEIRKTDADAAQVYVAIGAVSPGEVRQKVANDPDSGYDNLEVDDDVMPPAEGQAAGDLDEDA